MISNLILETVTQTQPDMLSSILQLVVPIGAFGLIFYFLIYRPQKKQEKSVNDMRSQLKVGDEISTVSGVVGRVVKIKDDYFVIETGSDKVKLTMAKWALRAIENPASTTSEE